MGVKGWVLMGVSSKGKGANSWVLGLRIPRVRV